MPAETMNRSQLINYALKRVADNKELTACGITFSPSKVRRLVSTYQRDVAKNGTITLKQFVDNAINTTIMKRFHGTHCVEGFATRGGVGHNRYLLEFVDTTGAKVAHDCRNWELHPELRERRTHGAELATPDPKDSDAAWSRIGNRGRKACRSELKR